MINDWAERHPKEILILALSHFKGFERNIEEQLHIHLINLIKTLFGARLLHRVVKTSVSFNHSTRDSSLRTLCFQVKKNLTYTTSEVTSFNVCQQDIPTLKSCWDQGRNVIVSYDYPANQHPEMWGKIPYYYGDSMDPGKVETELRRVLETARPCQCEFSLFPQPTRLGAPFNHGQVTTADLNVCPPYFPSHDLQVSSYVA